MELVEILIVVGVVVLVIGLWLAVGLRHLKFLKMRIGDAWKLVEQGLEKRHNLVPNLVETERRFLQEEEFFKKVISVRRKAAVDASSAKERVEYEHDLSNVIGEMMKKGRENQGLGQDTNFLELKKEIADLASNIEERTVSYNQIVRHYNRYRSALIIKPLAAIFGYKVANIFEFEG